MANFRRRSAQCLIRNERLHSSICLARCKNKMFSLTEPTSFSHRRYAINKNGRNQWRGSLSVQIGASLMYSTSLLMADSNSVPPSSKMSLRSQAQASILTLVMPRTKNHSASQPNSNVMLRRSGVQRSGASRA